MLPGSTCVAQFSRHVFDARYLAMGCGSSIASCTSPIVGRPPKCLGTGSARAAKRVTDHMGLVNQATKFSKSELAPDSPEMIEFIAVVKKAGCGISLVGWSKTSWMDPRGLRPLDHPLHLLLQFCKPW